MSKESERKPVRSLGLRVSLQNINWALVEYDQERVRDAEDNFTSRIIDTGVREIPLTVKERQSYERVEANKEAQDRHARRSARRNLQRFRQRRDSLMHLLKTSGIISENTSFVEGRPGETLFLRAKAAIERIELEELGRVLIQINAKRGFKSNRKTEKDDSVTEYKEQLKQRSQKLHDSGLTIAQFLIEESKDTLNGRTRGNTFYRKDHEEEFDRIWNTQKEFHPVLTDKLYKKMKGNIIFYQRKLKSQKGNIAFCPFESRFVQTEEEGRKVYRQHGCRVAPRSSPMFQEYRMWCDIANLRVKDTVTGVKESLSADEMKLLADTLRYRRSMKSAAVLKTLGLDPKRNELSLGDGEILGNLTLAEFMNAARKIAPETKKSKTGEAGSARAALEAAGEGSEWLYADFCTEDDTAYQNQVSIKLWHLLYSYIEDSDSLDGYGSLKEKIMQLCGVSEKAAEIISDISLTGDYGSLSHKAMKNLLPHIMEGRTLFEAQAICGYEERTERFDVTGDGCDPLQPLKKNSLQNPTAEKIVNQVLGTVRDIIDTYGKPDRIVFETDRMLKASRKVRKTIYDNNRKQAAENERITKILKAEFGLQHVSTKDINKYRLYMELEKNGFRTLYSDRYIPKEALFDKTAEVNIDHIIPKHLIFDESWSNKTLEYKDVNSEKSHTTALDYMSQKYGEEGAAAYRDKIESLYRAKAIGRTKRDKLLTPAGSIPEDLIDRQAASLPYSFKVLRSRLEACVDELTVTMQEITSKIVSDWRLHDAAREQAVVEHARHHLTRTETLRNGETRETAPLWDPSKDPRAGTAAAVAVAFTKRSWIQYLNTLSAQNRPDYVARAIKEKETILVGSTRMFIPPLPLDFMKDQIRDCIARTLVSSKVDNKVVSKKVNRFKSGKEMKSQITLVPRGQLHADTLRGRRLIPRSELVSVDARMTVATASCICSDRYRNAVLARLASCGNDPKKAFAGSNSPARKPIWLDEYHIESVPQKVKCMFMDEVFTVRKDITPELFKSSIADRDPEKIFSKVLDRRKRNILIRRFMEKGCDLDKAFGNITDDPIWTDSRHTRAMMKVTVYESMTNILPVRPDLERNEGRNHYASPDNNHHTAVYKDAEGNYHYRIVTMLEAVQRATKGLPPVDRELNKEKGWEFVAVLKKNETYVFPDPETGFDPKSIDLTDPANRREIGRNLYRLQMMTKGTFAFRLHCDKNSKFLLELKNITWKKLSSPERITDAVKVRLNRAGQIVKAEV